MKSVLCKCRNTYTNDCPKQTCHYPDYNRQGVGSLVNNGSSDRNNTSESRNTSNSRG